MVHTDGMKDVEKLINRFGGMRPMARTINVPVSTIQGWKKRDFIPSDRMADIVKAARNNSISLDGLGISTGPQRDSAHIASQSSGEDAPSAPSASPLRPKQQSYSSDTTDKRHEQMTAINVKQLRSEAVRRSVFTTLAIILVVGGIAYALFGKEAQDISNMARNQNDLDQRLDAFRKDYDSFETTVTDGLNNVNTRVSEISGAVGVERDSEGNVVLNNEMTVSERVTALESRLRASGEEIDIGQLVTRFNTLTGGLQTGSDNDAAMADLKSIIDGIQGRIGELDTALNQARSENEELAASLENVTGRDVSAAAMLLAMTQMRESLNRSEPFAEDLQILQRLVGEEDPELTAAIDRLAPYAEGGVLTPQGLSGELRGLTGEIISASLRGEDVSVKEKMAARLGQILSIEKDGKPVMGIKEQAIIANAQNALDKGDVAAAVAELNKLEGEAAQAASPVTLQAMGTLNAQNTVDMLMQNMMTKLQDPNQIRGLIQNLPAQIKNQIQGTQPIILTE